MDNPATRLAIINGLKKRNKFYTFFYGLEIVDDTWTYKDGSPAGRINWGADNPKNGAHVAYFWSRESADYDLQTGSCTRTRCHAYALCEYNCQL